MKLTQTELYAAIGKLIDRIEACGASPSITDAVVLASDIRQSVGDEWNTPNEYAANRVVETITEK